MKNAFAMRSNLGDPGICKPGDVPGAAGSTCFQDLQDLLTAMLSPAYAETLKCVPHLFLLSDAVALTDRCFLGADIVA